MTLPVRFSHLKAYGRSGLHGQYARQTDTAETRAMELGTAVHAILFGTRAVCGYPGPVRRGKEYEAFASLHADYEILTKDDYAKSLRMAEAVSDSKVAAPYLKGIHEKTLLFRWMGFECRATPDNRGDDFVTELKTTANSDPVKFVWHARRMAYHAQLRFQEFGCEKNHVTIRDHWIVAVEATEPHPVTVFHLEPEAREEGEKLLMLWAERMKACEAANHYPPYVECAVPLTWPKDEFELEFGETA